MEKDRETLNDVIKETKELVGYPLTVVLVTIVFLFSALIESIIIYSITTLFIKCDFSLIYGLSLVSIVLVTHIRDKKLLFYKKNNS